jgi:hypothetical protein
MARSIWQNGESGNIVQTGRENEEGESNVPRYRMSLKLGQVAREQPANPAAWMTQAPGKKPKGMKRIEHPIFLKAIDHITDQYWIEHMTEMAGGKFLPGFSMRDGCLRYKQGSHTFSVIMPDEPAVAAKVTISFMNKFFIESEKDREESMQKPEKNQQVAHHTWKEMSKSMRKHALCEFVTRECSSNGMTKHQMNEFYELIRRGIGDKRITSDHITCSENRVVKIDGLTYSSERGWHLDPVVCPLPRVPKSKVKLIITGPKYDKGQVPRTTTSLSKYIVGLAKKVGTNMSNQIDTGPEDEDDEDIE